MKLWQFLHLPVLLANNKFIPSMGLILETIDPDKILITTDHVEIKLGLEYRLYSNTSQMIANTLRGCSLDNKQQQMIADATTEAGKNIQQTMIDTFGIMDDSETTERKNQINMIANRKTTKNSFFDQYVIDDCSRSGAKCSYTAMAKRCNSKCHPGGKCSNCHPSGICCPKQCTGDACCPPSAQLELSRKSRTMPTFVNMCMKIDSINTKDGNLYFDQKTSTPEIINAPTILPTTATTSSLIEFPQHVLTMYNESNVQIYSIKKTNYNPVQLTCCASCGATFDYEMTEINTRTDENSKVLPIQITVGNFLTHKVEQIKITLDPRIRSVPKLHYHSLKNKWNIRIDIQNSYTEEIESAGKTHTVDKIATCTASEVVYEGRKPILEAACAYDDSTNIITNQLISINMTISNRICKLFDLYDVNLYSTQPVKHRGRRDLSFFKYWMKGGALSPASINSEVKKLRKLEIDDLDTLRHTMVSRADLRHVIADITKTEKTNRNNLCVINEKFATGTIFSHINGQMTSTINNLKMDVTNCNEHNIPTNIGNHDLQAICHAINTNHHACSNPAIIRDLFSCKLERYILDNRMTNSVMVYVTLRLNQLDISPKRSFYVNTIGIPFNSPVLTGLDALGNQLSMTTMPPTTITPADDLKELLKNHYNRMSLILNRNKRSYEQYTYIRLKNLPQIIMVRPSDGKIASMSNCKIITDKTIFCENKLQELHQSDNDCIRHIIHNDVDKIKMHCAHELFSGDQCISLLTYHDNHLISTFTNVPILSKSTTSDLFDEQQLNDCKANECCYISNNDAIFQCIRKIKNQRDIYENIKIDNPTVDIKLGDLDSALDLSQNTLQHMSRLMNNTIETRNKLDNLLDHKVINQITKINDGHTNKAKIIGYTILAVVATVLLIYITYKIVRSINECMDRKARNLAKRTLPDIVRDENKKFLQ